jgi:hypothetical protein
MRKVEGRHFNHFRLLGRGIVEMFELFFEIKGQHMNSSK